MSETDPQSTLLPIGNSIVGYKYNLGDEVIVSFNRKNTVGVVEDREKDMWGATIYKVRFADSHGASYAYFGEDALSLPSPPVKRVCECGLKFSREGGNHSSWCPMAEEV